MSIVLSAPTDKDSTKTGQGHFDTVRQWPQEAPKHFQAIAQADFAQHRMIGKQFIQIVPHIPAHTESICNLAQEQAFGADVFKEHDQLEFEEYGQINGRTALARIGLLHQLSHECELEGTLEMLIEVIYWN